jgi:pimeloyl-ACP methyl ester carboxylesterase
MMGKSIRFVLDGTMRRRASTRLVAIVGVGAACVLSTRSAAANEPDPYSPDCDAMAITVTLAPTDPTPYAVAAWVCGVRGPHSSTVQLLLHGSTYSHLYWDFPEGGDRYSYVNAASRAGYVTVNIDRIGIGLSSHPPAALVTVESNAYVAHQIITALRDGSLSSRGDRLFARRVVVVGHSLGSSIAAVEAATYGDADAVILSGFLHNEGPKLVAFGSDVYPASMDPETSTAPPLYFTTLPGTRGEFFYNLPDADPRIIAEDEATKQTVTVGELSTFEDGFGVTPSIQVPVLVAVGDEDALFCDAPSCTAGGTLAREAPFYSPQAELETYALPGAGHSMNLHLDAPLWFAVANEWIGHRVRDH